MALALPAEAWAKKVYSPIVEEGEFEIEYQLDFQVDSDPAKDGASKHQFEIAYGITDRWHSGIYAVYVKNPGSGFTYDRLKWENIYQLFEQGERWLDAGLYFEYQVPDASRNAPDVLEFKLLLEKELSPLLHTANLVLKKELGALATQNTTLGYAWRSKWRLSRAFEPGFEAFGAMGEIANLKSPNQQSHLLGPVVSGKLAGMVKYELGYLFGLTSGSVDGNLKAVVELEF